MLDSILGKLLIGVAIVVLLGATLYGFYAPNGSALTDERIEATVKDYLLENPEVVIDALKKYENNEREARQKSAQQNISKQYDALVNDKTSPVLGNPDGDVTVVEFFDYACGYCKRAYPNVKQLIESDDKVRVVLKEYPILGVNSATAARAAMAVHMLAPEKYAAIHSKLMEGRITGEEFVLKQVDAIGMDRAKVKAKMDSDEVMKAIEGNVALARSIGASGTPAFVIGEAFVPGAIDLSAMKSLVAQARSAQ